MEGIEEERLPLGKCRAAVTKTLQNVFTTSIASFLSEALDTNREAGLPVVYAQGRTYLSAEKVRDSDTYETKLIVRYLTERDAKLFSEANKGAFHKVSIPSDATKMVKGLCWIVKTSAINHIDFYRPIEADVCWKILSYGKRVEQVTLNQLILGEHQFLPSLCRMEALTSLTVTGASIVSKATELRFFRALESLSCLKSLNYSHLQYTERCRLSFSFKLHPKTSLKNIEKLMNLWTPICPVDCDFHLSGWFSNIFCRYILTSLFYFMNGLTTYGCSWEYFKEEEFIFITPGKQKRYFSMKRPLPPPLWVPTLQPMLPPAPPPTLTPHPPLPPPQPTRLEPQWKPRKRQPSYLDEDVAFRILPAPPPTPPKLQPPLPLLPPIAPQPPPPPGPYIEKKMINLSAPFSARDIFKH